MINDLFVAGWLSLKQLIRNNKKSVVLTVIVVALLFINILFVASMMSGFILAINKQIINYQYGNVVIEPTKATQSNIYIKQADKVIGSIRNIPGILGAVQHYKSGVKITYDKNKKGNNVKNISASLFSIKPSEESKVLKINSHIVSGRYLKSRDRNKILIGREISGGFGATFDMKSLGGVKVGDEVYVHYPNGVNRKYEVVGIFSTKNFLADAQAYITKDEMEDVLEQHDLADEIIVKTATTGNEDKYISSIKNVSEQKLNFYSWDNYLGALASVVSSFNFIKIIFYFIGLAVSGASIFIIIYIDLNNQRKQIGILKAIGMKNRIIIISYVFQAFFYGLLGIIVGRLLFEYAILPYFFKHPFNFPIGYVNLNIEKIDLVRTEISMLVVSIIGGLIPSIQIVKKNIIELIFK